MVMVCWLVGNVPSSAHPEHVANTYTERGNRYAQQEKWSKAAKEYAKAIRHGLQDPATAYICATFYTFAGNEDRAFAYLDSAVVFDYTNVQRLQYDTNLQPLRRDDRWPGLVSRMEAAQENYLLRNNLNRDLFFLWKETVYDHSIAVDSLPAELVTEHDYQRAKRISNLLEQEPTLINEDYYTAARILYYSDQPEHLTLGEWCMQEALETAPHHVTYRWFNAYVTDKRLRSEGQPQIYGTQVSEDSLGFYQLEPIDETVISDSLRLQIGLPTLDDFRAQIARDNEER